MKDYSPWDLWAVLGMPAEAVQACELVELSVWANNQFLGRLGLTVRDLAWHRWDSKREREQNAQ